MSRKKFNLNLEKCTHARSAFNCQIFKLN